MKLFALLALAITSAPAMAKSKPLAEPVEIKNQEFAQMIVGALKNKVRPKIVQRVGGSSEIYRVGMGLECAVNSALVSGGRIKRNAVCRILPGSWNFFGMEAYGSGEDEKFTDLLFQSLDVKETSEEGIRFKTIEWNVEDGQGGTERNLLACTQISKEAEGLGLRNTCLLINAL